MVLEATMICLDNSDWMRNGDYAPSRLEAQHDAASMLCNDRTGSNPENTVGILTMAGHGVDLLVSPTEEIGKILAAFAGITIGGTNNLITSVQIAQLALKHRKNKNGGQRIIAFVGGPINDTLEKLQKTGKQLKKNNVAIDVVSIGEIEENSEKLLEFVNAANSNDNSHLITVPAGVSPANAIMSSPIMHSASMGGAAASAGGNFDMYGGIDPEMDPELAMAIRISAEEARAHEEGLKAAQEQSEGTADGASSSSGAAAPALTGVDDQDDDALMQQALAMSMQEMMNAAEPGATDEGSTGASTAVGAMDIAGSTAQEDEDEDLRRAMELSIGAQDGKSGDNADSTEFADPTFVSQLLGNSDQSDPLIQQALQQLQQASDSQEQNDNSNDGNGKKRKNQEDENAK